MISIGISGAGMFAEAFIPLFAQHPLVERVVLADLVPERLAEVAQRHGLVETVGSHAELCASDVDAVAIFAQRHLHGPLTLEALDAGKHTYCAVPIASSLDDVGRIVSAVERTGLVYASGETSYYYPHTIYCRDRYARGDFGAFVYAEGNYLHDMAHGFYAAFQHSGGEQWRRVAGYPPMLYPTHSTGAVLGVTGARVTDVSCLGYADVEEDGVFGVGANEWDNPYSNQTALMRTDDGGMLRVNEFRRIGWRGTHGGNPLTIYGTRASFEENAGSQVWVDRDGGPTDVTGLLACAKHVEDTADDGAAGAAAAGSPGDVAAEHAGLHEVLREDFSSRYSAVHPVHRLPQAYARLRNGHLGSHHFLADDFVRAVVTRTVPPVNVWEAAAYAAPGIVAHASSLAGGDRLPVPDFGRPPTDRPLLAVDVPAEELVG
ncbi:oxidoreductase domain protein [Beutenbergia cavernae DSM 12333]|uniref:Oxidoreductase domain protein n=1 Tax=Beutenbergia cavernae (strain ATCC BAA-8 / DSM 12333 / CCUG 43141 / JCM 11478 / NBRC 16432 / NCIMB 13614 / HKI 0122) TaxID=471853 RepID=C5BVL3_BEUC1|nr:Gfo/Idh/MocA family oxidoreductase [Beutenbergia cavernae]ACQ78453.1 oxidoreductase domain protein [Beutenbergia cavernae DSM 12333]